MKRSIHAFACKPINNAYFKCLKLNSEQALKKK
jgi:hypothetical protein